MIPLYQVLLERYHHKYPQGSETSEVLLSQTPGLIVYNMSPVQLILASRSYTNNTIFTSPQPSSSSPSSPSTSNLEPLYSISKPRGGLIHSTPISVSRVGPDHGLSPVAIIEFKTGYDKQKRDEITLGGGNAGQNEGKKMDLEEWMPKGGFFSSSRTLRLGSGTYKWSRSRGKPIVGHQL